MSDRWLRWSTSAVVLAVAAFAAVVSYSHIYDLGRSHGQSGTAARLLPLSVDGLILAASLVLLHQARQGGAERGSVTSLARWMLGLGVGATVGANVAFGGAFGPLGAVISAWPAIAFIGSAEMLIGLVRASGHQVPGIPKGPVRSMVPGSKEEAAVLAFEASVRGGNALSERALADRFDLTRAVARRIRSEVVAAANGHG